MPTNFLGGEYHFNQKMFVFPDKSLLGNSQSIYQHLRGVSALKEHGLRRRTVSLVLPGFCVCAAADIEGYGPGEVATVCHLVQSFDPFSLYFHIF